jgi:hypothetical protein
VNEPAEPVSSTELIELGMMRAGRGHWVGRRLRGWDLLGQSLVGAVAVVMSEEAAHQAKEGTIGRSEGLSLDLAPEHGYLVAKGEQLYLVCAVGARHEDDGFERSPQRGVDERPQLAPRRACSHRGRG